MGSKAYLQFFEQYNVQAVSTQLLYVILYYVATLKPALRQLTA